MSSRTIRLVAAGALGVAAVLAGARTACASPETVETKASDGKAVELRVYAPEDGAKGRPAIIAMPEVGRPPEDWAPLVDRCMACGMTFIAVKHRLPDKSSMLQPSFADDLEALRLDAAAGVTYARETLGARADGIALVGDGFGGQAAANAAAEDPRVVAVVQVGGSPGLTNLTLYRKGWNDRPMGFVINDADDKKDVNSALKMIEKEDYAESIVVTAEAGVHGTRLFGVVDGLTDRIIARFHAWLNRPQVDGVPDEEKPADAAPTAHYRSAAAGGGVVVSGYLDPAAGRLASVEVLVHPVAGAQALDATSRRVVLKPKSGRTLTATFELFAWDGKHWKSRRKGALVDCGGIVLGKDAQTYEVWLSPHDLDIPPFSTIAVASTGYLGKEPLWSGVPSADGAAPAAPSDVDVADPSTWATLELK